MGTDALVGTVEVQLSVRGLPPGLVNISYGVFPKHRGHGYARRAVVLVCDWLRSSTDARTAILQIDPINVHSMRVGAESGFQPLGLVITEQGELLLRFGLPLGEG